MKLPAIPRSPPVLPARTRPHSVDMGSSLNQFKVCAIESTKNYSCCIATLPNNCLLLSKGKKKKPLCSFFHSLSFFLIIFIFFICSHKLVFLFFIFLGFFLFWGFSYFGFFFFSYFPPSFYSHRFTCFKHFWFSLYSSVLNICRWRIKVLIRISLFLSTCFLPVTYLKRHYFNLSCFMSNFLLPLVKFCNFFFIIESFSLPLVSNFR